MAKRLVYILIVLLAVSGFAATHGTLVDKRDGKKYKTVKIGDQTWMAENLNYNAASSFCYNNKESNCAKYGRLYTWAVAVGKSEEACGYGHTCSLPSDNIQGVCPDGWHLPSKVEWEILFYAVGGPSIAGTKLKSKSGWYGNGNGTDDFSFSALPAGLGNYGDYNFEGEYANFWSSSEIDSETAYDVALLHREDKAILFGTPEFAGYSVRCIKDETVVPATEVTVDSMTDSRDDQTYKIVKIGTQTWMAKNLNYRADSSLCNNNDGYNCAKYGRLYTWQTALKACPSGWHLPSKVEFETLIEAVSGKFPAGMVLKSKSGWNYNGNGMDAFGFSALPVGLKVANGNYKYEGEYANFWSSSEFNSYDAYRMCLYYFNNIAKLDNYYKGSVFSVRCIKDDASGQTYKTVKIGTQTWMAENLNVETEGSWCYEDKELNCQKYGRLYNWDAAKSACPAGWHLPSKGEFEALFVAVGGKDVAGMKLKSTSDWNENGNGDDIFGFSALPAGSRFSYGHYFAEGNSANFWISSEFNSNDADNMYLFYKHDRAGLYHFSKDGGLSVRCLKDSQ